MIVIYQICQEGVGLEPSFPSWVDRDNKYRLGRKMQDPAVSGDKAADESCNSRRRQHARQHDSSRGGGRRRHLRKPLQRHHRAGYRAPVLCRAD